MSRGFRDLAAFVVVSFVLGAAALFATTSPIAAASLQAAAERHAASAFAGPYWEHLPALGAGAFVLALVLTAFERAFGRAGGTRRPARPLAASDRDGVLAEVRSRVTASLERAEPDVVAAWEDVLRGAVALAASDVHLTPSGTAGQLTYRVQGDLHELASVPVTALPPLVVRMKILAYLDTTIRSLPQDGRLATTVDETAIEARVSTLPTESGERLVLRILRGGRTVPDIEALGLHAPIEAALLTLLSRPQGILFVTGPVGSGKTTTLYASLQYIARTRAKTTTVVTLEDPIELELPFATQTQMGHKGGMTFASTLRSVLRQDPNVLMVGEIRDVETGEIALQAGLTGHLILTTVHGHGAAGAFARLVEMGIEPFLLVGATVGCLSQRLVRRLCPACRRTAPIDPAIAERFAKAGHEIPAGTPFHVPMGCAHCSGEGWLGRIPIAELLEMSESVQRAIQSRAPTHEISEIAVKAGMVPLLADGLRAARAGETSLAEVLRVAG